MRPIPFSPLRHITYVIVATLVFVSSMPLTIRAQRPIVVTADQPNIWTLEQAHYLLAQMHRRNLDLKAASLEQLDANAINGVSVDALKTLLSVSAEFDQSVGANNRLLRNEKRFNATRREELITRRSRLQDESLTLTRRIADLKIKHSRAESEDEKTLLQSQIDELTTLQAAVKEQIGQTNEEYKTLASTGNFESLDMDTPTTSSAGTYTSVFQETAKKVIEQFSNSPKLNASLRLDNYLQMQYEILSKQLTLLRDEVGPGERLIFMEIPQSINSTHDRANDKWAQSWWKIAGYSQCVIYDNDGRAVPCSRVLRKLDRTSAQSKHEMAEVVDRVRSFDSGQAAADYKQSVKLTAGDLKWVKFVHGDYRFKSGFGAALIEPTPQTTVSEGTRNWLKGVQANGVTAPPQPLEETRQAEVLRTLNDFIEGKILPTYNFKVVNNYLRGDIGERSVTRLQTLLPPNSPTFRRLYLEEVFYDLIMPLEAFSQNVVDLDQSTHSNLKVAAGAENRVVRVVDLFPRQSSLNVNDLKLRNSAYSFKGVFQLISGFGAGGNYQREREQYSQFIQQELYSSAFGKGGREFGWTFNPMPGTRRLLSGVRTTYAIVIVPEDTTSIIMESKGCYFPRSSPQPTSFNDAAWAGVFPETNRGCLPGKKFIIPIPDGGVKDNNFGVTEVRYEAVKKGGRAVVSIYGRNFSSQIGVLVNGVPLTQSLGLGQPFIRDDSNAGEAIKTEFSASKVKGSFERVGTGQIVATFEMEENYEGVPNITLVAPGKAEDLKSLDNILVNDKYMYRTFGDVQDWPYIFGKKVGTKEQEVSVERVGVFQNDGMLDIVVTGKNLTSVKSVYVNGRKHDNPDFKAQPATDQSQPGTTSPQASPTPTPDPDSYKKHLISLRGLPPLQTEKTIQITLLTPDGALNTAAVENPAFKKDGTQQDTIRYVFDETKLALSTAPTLRRCEEGTDKVIHATYELGGVGFTERTKAFVVNKDKEEEQELVYEGGTRVVLTLVNPKPRQIIVVKDAESKLKAQRVVVWKKPETGCS
ncbi:MAG TPA: hypothetical protein VEZ40_09325 [Pyrinomonadaceae bacterium]|nr:hypothetical protein [Pyrinomonadaceae bacterium]